MNRFTVYTYKLWHLALTWGGELTPKRLELILRDDGVGISPNINLESVETLGLSPDIS